jgi:hypothetical protein
VVAEGITNIAVVQMQKRASKTKEAITITIKELWSYVQDPPTKGAFLAAEKATAALRGAKLAELSNKKKRIPQVRRNMDWPDNVGSRELNYTEASLQTCFLANVLGLWLQSKM